MSEFTTERVLKDLADLRGYARHSEELRCLDRVMTHIKTLEERAEAAEARAIMPPSPAPETERRLEQALAAPTEEVAAPEPEGPAVAQPEAPAPARPVKKLKPTRG